MRMMLKFTLPIEKGNAAINDGSLGRTMESIMSKLKPEAAYFTPMDGKRGGVIFFDLAEPSQIPEVVEPLFLNLNAATELTPVMNADSSRRPDSRRTRRRERALVIARSAATKQSRAHTGNWIASLRSQ